MLCIFGAEKHIADFYTNPLNFQKHNKNCREYPLRQFLYRKTYKLKRASIFGDKIGIFDLELQNSTAQGKSTKVISV
jgi:hypothetical protein